MKDIVVIYHGKCRDGFGGAWAAWKKFGDSANYYPAQRAQEPPEIKNKEIYFIDFTYSPEITKKYISENKKIVIIDHHITAQEAVKLASENSFDINHSGAVLAWQYFFPGQAVPKLFQHIEDTDLWRFNLENTREIAAFLELYDFDFKLWDEFFAGMEDAEKRKKYIEEGKVVLRYEAVLLKDAVEDRAELVEFEGYKVLAVNYPHFLASDLGHVFVVKNPPMGIVWSEKKGMITVSLRSNGIVDVSAIAQKYGGGGHKAAAGFSFPANQPKPWKKIN